MTNRITEPNKLLGLVLFVILSLSILTVIPNSSALVKDSQDRIENQIDQTEKYRTLIVNADKEISELSNGSIGAENTENSQAFSSPRVKPENDHSSDTATQKTTSLTTDGLDVDKDQTQMIAQQTGRSFTITSDVVQPGAGGLVAYEQHIRLSGSLTTEGNLIVGTGTLQYVCKKIFYNVDGSLDITNPRYTDISGTLPNNVLMGPVGPGLLEVNAADFNLGLPSGCGFFQNVPFTLGPNGGIFASGSNPSTFHTYEISVPNSLPSTNLHVVTPIGQIKPGDVVVLDVGYSDPDGDRLNGYNIVQTGGPTVNLEPGTPSFGQYRFTVPQVTEDTTFSFESTVADGLMELPALTSAPSSLDILVKGANNPPIAVATADKPKVISGDTVTLDGTQSHDPDPGDSIVSYRWEQISGPSVDLTPFTPSVSALSTDTPLAIKERFTSNQPSGATELVSTAAVTSPVVQFTAPDVTEEILLAFSLSVADKFGASGVGTIQVAVQPVAVQPCSAIQLKNFLIFNPKTGSREIPYGITAGSLQEAGNKFKFKADDGTPVAANTSGTWLFNYVLDDEGKVGCKSRLTVTITTEMPRWNNVKRLDPVIQDEWKRFLPALGVHESRHAQLFHDQFEGIASKIIGKTPGEAETILRNAGSDETKHIKYDKMTDHGCTEGAKLDLNPGPPLPTCDVQ